MDFPQTTTCWTLIKDAAAGKNEERAAFAQRYSHIVRAYVIARWKGRFLDADVDDACQEVFAECFRVGGPLDRADPEFCNGFRSFLYGIVRNVVARIEERRMKNRRFANQSDFAEINANETSLSRVFDRAWALGIMKQATVRHKENAERAGKDALRRVELLRLRFREEIPIREIAQQWQIDPTKLHREFAKAKEEFRLALRAVVFDHNPTALPGEIERQCEEFVGVLA